MKNYLKEFQLFIDKWPGKERLGPYRFLPVFFISGAALEYAMIHWRPNGINFYDTFKEKKAREAALKKYSRLKEIEEFLK